MGKSDSSKGSALSRREFVKSLGLTVSAPLLPSVFSFEAEAQAAEVPKRFVAIHSMNGQRKQYWSPLAPVTSSFGAGRELQMGANLPSGLNQILQSGFAPYMNSGLLTMVQGLDHVIGTGHNFRAMLGHFVDERPIPTIDQVLARSSKFYRGKTPVAPSLLLGNTRSISFGLNNGVFQNLPVDASVASVLERVFLSATAPKLNGGSNVIEKILGEYERLKGHPKLGTADKRQVQLLGDSLSDLRTRLRNTAPLSCQVPSFAGSDAFDNEKKLEAFVDLIYYAFLCGATQVAVLNIDVASPIADPNSWHGSSHEREEVAEVPILLNTNRWIANKFLLRLMNLMDNAQEANGKSMLYNSLIYWGNEISVGWSHEQTNMPVILAGAAGGKIRGGYVYDFQGPNRGGGAMYPYGLQYNRLLVTILQSMGLTAADYEVTYRQERIPGYGWHKSSRADRNAPYEPFVADIGKPLPRVFVA